MIVEHESGCRSPMGPANFKLPACRWFNVSLLAEQNGIGVDEIFELAIEGVVYVWDALHSFGKQNASVAVVNDEAFAAYLAARRLEREVETFGDRFARAATELKAKYRRLGVGG